MRNREAVHVCCIQISSLRNRSLLKQSGNREVNVQEEIFISPLNPTQGQEGFAWFTGFMNPTPQNPPDSPGPVRDEATEVLRPGSDESSSSSSPPPPHLPSHEDFASLLIEKNVATAEVARVKLLLEAEQAKTEAVALELVSSRALVIPNPFFGSLTPPPSISGQDDRGLPPYDFSPCECDFRAAAHGGGECGVENKDFPG